jgi:putative hemolysin
MESQLTYKVFDLFFLFFLSAFLSCSEAALFSLTPLHVHKMGEDHTPFLAYVSRLLDYPRRLLITLIVSNEVINIALSIVSASLFIQFFGMDGRWMAIAVTTILLLIFGEAIPKTFAVIHPISVSSIVAPFIAFISYIERPVVWVLEKVTDGIMSLFPVKPTRSRDSLMEEEFMTLIDVGHREGALEEAQRDMIHRVFELSDKPVADVMIPRVDMFCLPIAMSMEEMKKEILEARHDIVPVYGSDRDDILGMLNAKDLMDRQLTGDRWVRIYTLLKKPYFVPEGKTAGSLLKEFQERRIKVAIVVDEFGGVSGMVTLRDILEDLVEDLYEQYASKEEMYQKINDCTLVASGRIAIEDLNAIIRYPLPSEDFETLGGYVFHLFGRLPSRGDEIEADHYVFRIEQMGKVRILKIRMEEKAGPEDD